MLTNNISIGDYVIATKYSDGDSKDHWVIGFFNGQIKEYGETYPRYDVIDENGNQFRGNGFRRVQKISRLRGSELLKVRYAIEHIDRSVWFWVRSKISDIQELSEFNK